MNENEMLYCLIAFILGYLVSRHIGDGFNVGGGCTTYTEDTDCEIYEYCKGARTKQEYGTCVDCSNDKSRTICKCPSRYGGTQRPWAATGSC